LGAPIAPSPAPLPASMTLLLAGPGGSVRGKLCPWFCGWLALQGRQSVNGRASCWRCVWLITITWEYLYSRSPASKWTVDPDPLPRVCLKKRLLKFARNVLS